jgi:hypothetical protein
MCGRACGGGRCQREAVTSPTSQRCVMILSREMPSSRQSPSTDARAHGLPDRGPHRRAPRR